MIDWSNPSQEAMAAAKMARLCAEKGGMNETMFAEWVLTAKESLWYLQAADWAENPPAVLKDEKSREIFKRGMALVVQIVDLEYDQESGWWWPLARIWPTQDAQQMGVLILMDTATMLERMKDIPQWDQTIPMAHQAPAFLTVSAGFWVFFSLACGPRWRQRYASVVQGMAEAARIKMGNSRGRRRR